jgi:hypothetical protein
VEKVHWNLRTTGEPPPHTRTGREAGIDTRRWRKFSTSSTPKHANFNTSFKPPSSRLRLQSASRIKSTTTNLMMLMVRERYTPRDASDSMKSGGAEAGYAKSPAGAETRYGNTSTPIKLTDEPVLYQSLSPESRTLHARVSSSPHSGRRMRVAVSKAQPLVGRC